MEENIDNGIPEQSNEQPENGNEEKMKLKRCRMNKQRVLKECPVNNCFEIVLNSGNVYGSSNPNKAPESNQAVIPEDPTRRHLKKKEIRSQHLTRSI